VVEVLGFLPEPSSAKVDVSAKDTTSKRQIDVTIDSSGLEFRAERATLMQIRFDEPYSVLLSHSVRGGELLLNLV